LAQWKDHDKHNTNNDEERHTNEKEKDVMAVDTKDCEADFFLFLFLLFLFTCICCCTLACGDMMPLLNMDRLSLFLYRAGKRNSLTYSLLSVLFFFIL